MKINLISAVVLIFTFAFGAHADDAAVARGKTKALACAACHGANGISQNPIWPNLAGQKKDYLLKQLADFKAARRVDPVMGPMAQTLSDQDMQDLAFYFSSL
jgi:cytochrome c553